MSHGAAAITIAPTELRAAAEVFRIIGTDYEALGLRCRSQLAGVRLNPRDVRLNVASVSMRSEQIRVELRSVAAAYAQDGDTLDKTANEAEHADAGLVFAIEQLTLDLAGLPPQEVHRRKVLVEARERLLLELADGSSEVAALLLNSANSGRLDELFARALADTAGRCEVPDPVNDLLAGENIGSDVYQEMLALYLLVQASRGEHPELIDRAYPNGSDGAAALAGDDALLILAHFLGTYGFSGLGDASVVAGAPNFPNPIRGSAAYLVENPDYYEMVGGSEATYASLNAILAENAEIREAVLDQPNTWNDVHANAFNQHAFAHDPEAARQFVLALPGTQDDRTGRTSGLDFKAVGTEGFRATSSAALLAADSLTDEVVIVSRLPETQNADRNSLFNLYYGELAREMNLVLNPTPFVIDPTNPLSPNHSGANWAYFGASASDEVGSIIDNSQDIPGPLTTSDSTRQQAADGNQWIFGTIAPAFAMMIDQSETREGADHRSFTRNYLLSEDANGRPLFPEGSGELRDGLLFYHAAATTEDPVERQRLAFVGSALLGTYEQGGIDHFLNDIWDLSIADDGIVQGASEPLAFLLGGDSTIATSMAGVDLGLDGERFRLDSDIAIRDPQGSLISNLDMPTDLNPADHRNQTIRIGDLVVGRGPDPDADIVLDRIYGVSDPSPGLGVDPFPGSAVEWEAEGGHEDLVAGGHYFREDDFTADGHLAGTGAIDWSNPESRMHYIANWFHQMHGDPALFESVDDFTVEGNAPWLPDDVTVRFEP